MVIEGAMKDKGSIAIFICLIFFNIFLFILLFIELQAICFSSCNHTLVMP